MSSLFGHCHGEKTHFSRNEKNVFVKPYEQCRACSDIVMARIENRQHGALGEVERQNALFEERERTIQIFRNQCNESIETKNHKKNKEDATKCLLHPPPCVGLIFLLLIPLPYPFVTPKA